MRQSKARLIPIFIAAIVTTVIVAVVTKFGAIDLNGSSSITNVMCENLYVFIPINRMKPEKLEECLKDPQKHLTELRSKPVTSSLNVELLNSVTPIHNKFPLAGFEDYRLSAIQMITSDRLLIDTGSHVSLYYSEAEVEANKVIEGIGALGVANTYNVKEAHYENSYFEIENMNYVNSSEASIYNIISKYSGVLGMDYFATLKQFCFNMELSVISSYCFGDKDIFGRFVARPGSLLIHLPVEFDNKSFYALFDTGYLYSTYYSESCEGSDLEYISIDAFGNMKNKKSTMKTSVISMSGWEIERFQYICEYVETESPYLVLGSNFVNQHIRTIDFDFLDKVFTVKFRED